MASKIERSVKQYARLKRLVQKTSLQFEGYGFDGPFSAWIDPLGNIMFKGSVGAAEARRLAEWILEITRDEDAK